MEDDASHEPLEDVGLDINPANAKAHPRRLLGPGKRNSDEDRLVGPTSAPSTQGRPHTSPQPYNSSYQHPASPNRYCRSPSPALPSPASSQIFERDVQESAMAGPASPAVPSHLPRDNYIPSVLEASSLAITDDHLDPDEVKIVTHTHHHPVGLAVTGPSSIDASVHTLPEESIVVVDKDDTLSLYGTMDARDVHRLSFISFADVVQAEHAEQNAMKDSLHLSGLLPAFAPGLASNRSPSPVQSRASSQGFSTSPPTSGPVSAGGVEGSHLFGIKGPMGMTPTHSPPPVAGEISVETMRQAMTKTSEADLSGLRSQPMSAGSVEDCAQDVPWR
ncbi:MAG: hypothetical protein M1826_001335 [Phylliscum demangeonii]|nr:MAG: hypothetical protein M1826_001335 [Phylliscum demangeonii]